jgi:MULE transposase domain/SWIM zinc finger
MYNKVPISIITDQDPAMRVAIQEVWPETVHRCCQWHIMRKTRKKLLFHYGTDKSFKKKLENVVNRSLTVVDFERSWKKMIEEHALESNSHLKIMFANRDGWVPAFFRGTFFASMSTTQRSEGMNAVMKLMVDNYTYIYQFAVQLDKLIVGIWQNESDEDFRTINEVPKLWSHHNIEVGARRVYTRKIYNMFKKTLVESSNGVVMEVERDRLYEVNITCHPFIENWISETHQIFIDRIDDTISCSCKGFEFTGLLCSHSIKVMQYIGMQKLPEKYILKRWTKGANENTKRSTKERCMDMEESKGLESMRYAIIYPKLMAIGKLASKSGPTFALVVAYLDELMTEVSTMLSSKSDVEGATTTSNSPPEGTSLQKSGPVGVRTRGQVAAKKSRAIREYIDPPLSNCKGRKRKPQRLKPLVEKNAPKRRTCSYCNEQEGHNFRTCPKVMMVRIRIGF